MSRPLGAKHNPDAEPRGEPHERLAFMRESGDLPEMVDNRKHAKKRVNQTDQGCVGHGFGGAIRARGDAMGFEINVSDRAIYKGARQKENPKARYLPDEGSYPEHAVDWIQEVGIVDSTRVPEDDDVTARVGEDVLEAGDSALVTGVYRLDSGGEALKAAIMRACAKKHFIPYASNVGTSYMAYRGGVFPGETGEDRGGHEQFIAGYTPDGPIVVNSWGDHAAPDPWGEDGTAIVAWRWALAKYRSLFVVTLAPRVIL